MFKHTSKTFKNERTKHLDHALNKVLTLKKSFQIHLKNKPINQMLESRSIIQQKINLPHS